MTGKGLKTVVTLVACGGLVSALAGCACGHSKTSLAQASCSEQTIHTSEVSSSNATLVLDTTPQNASVGECFATVYVPPRFETVSERVCVKEAGERVEVVPAQYEWVEEKVCVKQASKQLIEVPAEYTTQTRTVMSQPGTTDWVREETANCKNPSGQKVKDVFCLVSQPAAEQTYTTKCLAKAATVKEIEIPAEYQMVRSQRLVCPATTKRIPIPAEYDTITKTVKTASARMEWQKVVCEGKLSAEKKNAIKGALARSGFATDAPNGELTERDWNSLAKYQEKNRLGTGALTFETMKSLGVSLQ